MTDSDSQWICAFEYTASDANKPGAESGEWLAFTGPVETASHRYNEEVLVDENSHHKIFTSILVLFYGKD